MQYHRDKQIDRLISQLLDALCMDERNTGRQTVLVLIPVVPDEQAVLAQSGKPIWNATPEDLVLTFATAFTERDPGLAERLRKAAYEETG